MRDPTLRIQQEQGAPLRYSVSPCCSPICPAPLLVLRAKKVLDPEGRSTRHSVADDEHLFGRTSCPRGHAIAAVGG